MKHINSGIYQEESMRDTAKDAEKIGAKLGEGMPEMLALQAALDALRADGRGLVKVGMEYEVARIVRDALAEQPAQGEAVAAVATAYIERQRLDGSWDMVARFTAPADPSSPDGLPRDGITLYTAPPAPSVQPAQGEQGVEGTGPMCAVDIDNGLRRYPWTYTNQPGNIGASVLGNCALRAKPGGDSIDHGLSLLRELHLQGLGIARVPALEVSEAQPHG